MNNFIQRWLNEATFAKVKKIGVIADQLGIPMAQLALAWVLRQANVASALIGASRPQQVVENAKASGYVLPPDVLEQLDEALE
jgi:aryl-alcohol dehydrogenase-like predicted oxidoreductase